MMKWIVKILKFIGIVVENKEKLQSIYWSMENVLREVKTIKNGYAEGKIDNDELIDLITKFNPEKMLHESQVNLGFADDIAKDLVELGFSKKGAK